jgi:creatinine amidohydrolase
MSFYFEDKTTTQIGEYAKKNALILLPVGMIEQHGPHLPVSTDNIIARGVARLVAQRISDKIPTLVMPCVFAGYHGDILMQWPGSTRVLPETLYNYVFDICDSLCQGGFKKILIINSHGQNPAILEIVCRRITDKHGILPILTYAMSMIGKKGANIRTSEQGGAAGHACEIETSLILALSPELVDMSLAPDSTCKYRTFFHPGDLYPDIDTIPKVYWSSFHLQNTPTGVLGDATKATREKGLKLLDCIVSNYEKLIDEYYYFRE